jgi:hypothetical protein
MNGLEALIFFSYQLHLKARISYKTPLLDGLRSFWTLL